MTTLAHCNVVQYICILAPKKLQAKKIFFCSYFPIPTWFVQLQARNFQSDQFIPNIAAAVPKTPTAIRDNCHGINMQNCFVHSVHRLIVSLRITQSHVLINCRETLFALFIKSYTTHTRTSHSTVSYGYGSITLRTAIYNGCSSIMCVTFTSSRCYFWYIYEKWV